MYLELTKGKESKKIEAKILTVTQCLLAKYKNQVVEIMYYLPKELQE